MPVVANLGWTFNEGAAQWELISRTGLVIQTATLEFLHRFGAAQLNRYGLRHGWPELVPGAAWVHCILHGGPMDGLARVLRAGRVRAAAGDPDVRRCAAGAVPAAVAAGVHAPARVPGLPVPVPVGPGRHMTAAALGALVAVARYKTGWRFRLEHGATSAAGSCWAGGMPDGLGATAAFPVMVTLAWAGVPGGVRPHRGLGRPGRMVLLEHRFLVPDDPGVPWHRWLLDCIHRVEIHEMCEAFGVGGQRPFYPGHGPDADLYAITDRGLPGPG